MKRFVLEGVLIFTSKRQITVLYYLSCVIHLLLSLVIVLIALFSLSEPPSPPRSVMAEATSPESITVTFLPPITWNSLTNIKYNLTYQPIENGNLSFIVFEAQVEYNMASMEERMIKGLEDDTPYIITVSAVNGFGSSPPSIPVQVSTTAFMSKLVIFGCMTTGGGSCCILPLNL